MYEPLLKGKQLANLRRRALMTDAITPEHDFIDCFGKRFKKAALLCVMVESIIIPKSNTLTCNDNHEHQVSSCSIEAYVFLDVLRFLRQNTHTGFRKLC